MPTAFRRSCTHLGEGPFFTLRIRRPAKIGQAFLFSGVKSSDDSLRAGEFSRHRLDLLRAQRAQSRRRQIARDADTRWPHRRDWA